jgi:hypothetical protein
MPAPRVSYAEFIELWKTHKSAQAVARAVDLAVEEVYKRRRRIEARHNIKLKSEVRPEVAERYKHLSQTEHNPRISVDLSDGVIMVFSDAHFWPGVRTPAFRAFCMLAQKLKPKIIINNGDAFDGASISRFPRIGWDSKPSILDELTACKDHLGEMQEAAPKAKLLWCLGNHDQRFENRLSANVPEFQGIGGFRLNDHFPDWKTGWSVWVNNDVVIKHRFRNGIHATRNNTAASGKSMVTGHLHSLKVTPMDDYNGTRWGVDAGTLADPSGPQFRDYLEDNPTDWRSGFIVLTFKNGQMLWPEVARVVGNQIDFRGELTAV